MDWDKAYRDHRGEVFRFLYGRAGGNAMLAEDLLQDTFVRAMRRAERFTYDDGRGVLPWLMTIARNLLADHFKRPATRRETPIADFPNVDLAPSAEHEVLERAHQDEVMRAVARLTPPQQQAVLLTYWGGMRDRQISHVAGVSEGSVRLLKFRARANLRRELAEVA